MTVWFWQRQKNAAPIMKFGLGIEAAKVWKMI